ncbi:hypothetical protein LTR70_008518 [Exophiala xenobiotica]|uniref:Uncharacterized protein n=1 Tax=Lithohypha guttulata TaxID=1690604 RepID=A0ABR0K0V8_9EURO|nr:hypothetical protein LTR24_008130 [Lithohypha guttulata]KAK5311870.1 hypothetical protein LTR70_008518 [Exophiala xenobiotica]
MEPSKRAIQGAERRYGQLTPAQSIDDHTARRASTNQSTLSRQSTNMSEHDTYASMTGTSLTEEPRENDLAIFECSLRAQYQEQELPSQASPPPPTMTPWMPTLEELLSDPQLVEDLARLRQKRMELSANAPLVPTELSPSFIPDAAQAAPPQPQCNGHRFGTVTIEGDDARVAQGNVLAQDMNPALVRNHDYGNVLLKKGARAPTLKQGDMDHEALCMFLGGRREPLA